MHTYLQMYPLLLPLFWSHFLHRLDFSQPGVARHVGVLFLSGVHGTRGCHAGSDGVLGRCLRHLRPAWPFATWVVEMFKSWLTASRAWFKLNNVWYWLMFVWYCFWIEHWTEMNGIGWINWSKALHACSHGFMSIWEGSDVFVEGGSWIGKEQRRDESCGFDVQLNSLLYIHLFFPARFSKSAEFNSQNMISCVHYDIPIKSLRYHLLNPHSMMWKYVLFVLL